MSDPYPMFNVPPTRRNPHNQALLLLIPVPTPYGDDASASATLPAALPVPQARGVPRRKPPPIDFSKIDGSHSFTPDTSSPANSSTPTIIQASATASSETSHESLSRAMHADKRAAVPGEPKTIDKLTPDDWNALANSNSIVELSSLGEGNGGLVAKCKLRSGSPVFALKVINVDPNPDIQKQIIRELQYNRKCDSPNIVKYYGTFMVQQLSTIGIAMEYMGGRSLDAIYKRVIEMDPTNRVSEKVLGKIAESVLNGLSYLHLKSIIHRDIKPSNILFDEGGNVKICDFGVSGEVVNSLANTFVGTQYYMAPERIRGNPYTVNCDVWSLGLSILEVASGQFPYHQPNQNPLAPLEYLSLILEYQPRLEDVPDEGIFWSDSLKNFVDYCLTKDPSERPIPEQMLRHPWCKGQLKIKVNMAKFVEKVWQNQ